MGVRKMYVKMAQSFFVLILTLLCFVESKCAPGPSVIPSPQIEVFKNGGLQITVPNVDGIRLFSFNGNINKVISYLQLGTISQTVWDPKSTLIFRNDSLNVKVGDTIYYYIYMIKNGLGYIHEDGCHEVKDFIDSPPPTPAPPPSSDCNCDISISQPPTTPSRITETTEELDKKWRSCHTVVLNLTQTLLGLYSQIDSIGSTNDLLMRIIETYPDSKELTFRGRLPLDDLPETLISFVLRERLHIHAKVLSTRRLSDGGIRFEVPTIIEKLEILRAAKQKLKNSKLSFEP